MSRTLYITDLDGTFLDPCAGVSDFAAKAVRELAARGVHLSAATARTAATVKNLLGGMGFDTPVVVMNGVGIYDIASAHYVNTYHIPHEARESIFAIVAQYDLAGFCYGVKDDVLSTCYESLRSPGAKRFMEERQQKFGKVFTKVDSFRNFVGDEMLYYSLSDREEKTAPAAEAFRKIDGVRVEFYRDIYEKDCFFLEVSSALASKKTAVDFLRRQYGFDRIVGFGDNYNDMALLEGCDAFYAVENGVDALKERSTAVIAPNTQDGVVRWLLENAR